jgi:hypothetical protein
LAVEWGGQVFDIDDEPVSFAVVTSLSSVCKLLDVELVTDRDPDVSGYWGRTGHYSPVAGCSFRVGHDALFVDHDRRGVTQGHRDRDIGAARSHRDDSG